MKNKWEKRFANLRLLGWLALIGLPLLVAAALTSGTPQTFCCVAGILLIAPVLIYSYVLVILHWKDRYRGKHSDLWGVLILIETSGWMKLVYLFRHLIPDITHTGRYQLDATNSETPQLPPQPPPARPPEAPGT